MPRNASAVNFEELRTNIRAAMQHLGWNASKLAEVCGIPQPTISRFLNRSTDSLRLDNLQMISRCLKTTVGALLGEVPLETNPYHFRILRALRAMPVDRLRAFADVSEIFANLDPATDETGNEANLNKKAAPKSRT